jgi:hypothetical protein
LTQRGCQTSIEGGDRNGLSDLCIIAILKQNIYDGEENTPLGSAIDGMCKHKTHKAVEILLLHPYIPPPMMQQIFCFPWHVACSTPGTRDSFDQNKVAIVFLFLL